MSGAPGFMSGAPGFMSGAPGFMSGAPGFMDGAPGFMPEPGREGASMLFEGECSGYLEWLWRE
ncbi:MAG: hypothetical protein ACKVK6_08380, partial [bacterium]